MRDERFEAMLDERLTVALDAVPEVRIPAEFAARVAREAEARFGATLVEARAPRFGPLMMRVALVALLAALLGVARVSVGTSVSWLAIEVVLCVEFVGLGVYLGLRPQ